MPRGKKRKTYKKRKSKSSARRKKSCRNSKGRSKTIQSSTCVPRSRTVIVSDIRRHVVVQGADTSAPSRSFPANCPATTFGLDGNVLDGVWRDDAHPNNPAEATVGCPGIHDWVCDQVGVPAPGSRAVHRTGSVETTTGFCPCRRANSPESPGQLVGDRGSGPCRGDVVCRDAAPETAS